MKRYDALETIINSLTGNEFIISCTGMISRELYSIKDSPHHFYTLGSMGLPSSIGLGLALTQPDKKVIVIEGDGGTLMGMGTIATIGNLKPKNLIQIVLDNEIHESTGEQKTVSNTMKLEIVAEAAGYEKINKVSSSEELKSVIKKCLNIDGPSFILVKIEKGRKDVPRVSIRPVKIQERFKNSLKIH
jgi:sulfopyruvate decarboxylase beta subunit